jgi:hypothetical protein
VYGSDQIRWMFMRRNELKRSIKTVSFSSVMLALATSEAMRLLYET